LSATHEAAFAPAIAHEIRATAPVAFTPHEIAAPTAAAPHIRFAASAALPGAPFAVAAFAPVITHAPTAERFEGLSVPPAVVAIGASIAVWPVAASTITGGFVPIPCISPI
jgi:hypothetical protein